MNEDKFPDGKIRFEIETLGPIRDSVIDFKPFLLYVGGCNSGKSYTAMAVYYLLFMLHDEKINKKLTRSLLDLKKIERDLNSRKTVELESPQNIISELEKMYNANIHRFIGYMLGHDAFSCDVKLKLNIPPPDATFHLAQPKGNERSISARIESRDPLFSSAVAGDGGGRTASDTTGALEHLVHDLCMRLVFGQSDYSVFFLPQARGAFSGLSPKACKGFSKIGMYKEFLAGQAAVMNSRSGEGGKLEKQKKFLNPYFNKLMHGEIKTKRTGASFAITGTDKEIPLSAASSLVRELYPLHLILNQAPVHKLSLCIEDPEAHLPSDLHHEAATLLFHIVIGGGFVQAVTQSVSFLEDVSSLLGIHYLKIYMDHTSPGFLDMFDFMEDMVLNPASISVYNQHTIHKDGDLRLSEFKKFDMIAHTLRRRTR